MENRPHYWWLSEEQRQVELQKDKEYEEFDRKHSDPYYGMDYSWIDGRRSGRRSKTLSFRSKSLEKSSASKQEIIDWLSTMEDSARFYVNISYQEKFPPRNRPSPPPDEEYSIKLEDDQMQLDEQVRLLHGSF
jgi:hypothetical protein